MRQSTQTLVIGTTIAVLVACSSRNDRPVASEANGKSSLSPSGEQSAAQGRSMVRLVNALPAGHGVNVMGDKRMLFTAVDYKAVTPYVQVTDNRIDFTLHRAPGDSAVASNSEMLRDGARYTIVALAGDKGEPRLRILLDDLSTDSSKARIRIINAAAGASDVDVALQGQKDALFHGVNFTSEGGYKAITPVTATVEIRRNNPSAAPVLIKQMRFEAGRSYSIVLASPKPGSLEAITVQDTESPSTLSMR